MASAISPLSPTSAAARNYAHCDADVDGGQQHCAAAEFSATHPAAPPADQIQYTQAAASPAAPVARFILVTPDAAGAPAPFDMVCKVGARLQLGREICRSGVDGVEQRAMRAANEAEGDDGDEAMEGDENVSRCSARRGAAAQQAASRRRGSARVASRRAPVIGRGRQRGRLSYELAAGVASVS